MQRILPARLEPVITARELAGLRRATADRRHWVAGQPPGGSERRQQAERRDIAVAPLSIYEWAEAACNYYYQHPAHGHKTLRWTAERRLSEGPPPASGERRWCADRRRPEVASIPLAEWAEAMSNYYYHFHRR